MGGVFYQVQAAAASSFTSLIMGMLNVWPSYTLGLYTSPNSTILSAPMTEFEGSLLGSLPALGAMAGTAMAGIIIDSLGRKRGGIVICLPFVISWALVEVSSSSILILIARFMGGISGGAALVFAPMFISETAEDSIRGMLANGPVAMYCLGAVFSYLLGWISNYHTIIWVNLAASVFGIGLLAMVMESPVYLLKQRREEEARAAIAHYRGASPASKVVLEELSNLKQRLSPAVEMITVTAPDNEQKPEDAEKEKLNTDAVVEEAAERMPVWKLLFLTPSSSQAFKVVAIPLTMQVFMGMVAVQVYAKELFAQAAPNLSSHFCSVLFAVILLSGSLVAAGIADRAGRRVLVITSSVLVAVFMVSLGFCLQTGLAPAWVTAMSILAYCFSFNIGAGTVPYVLLSEVFLPEVQSFASILLVEWAWFTNFVIIAIFPFMAKLLGIHGLFYIFAGVGVANAVICFFLVPETKGLSCSQIQEALLRRKK